MDETIDTITINDSSITIQDSTMDTIIIPDTQLTYVSTQDLDKMQANFDKCQKNDGDESLCWCELQPLQPNDDKENEPPLEDSIPCGQNKHSTPLTNSYGNEFMDGIENAPILNRKVASKVPLARRLFF